MEQREITKVSVLGAGIEINLVYLGESLGACLWGSFSLCDLAYLSEMTLSQDPNDEMGQTCKDLLGKSILGIASAKALG